MGISYNPSVITSGLVLALDAGNPKSYPGSGTTWTDLSGRGNNGTLVNGVGYNSSNLGGLSFDGINDYVDCGNPTSLSSIGGTNNITVSGWVYYTAYGGGGQPYSVITVKGNPWTWLLENPSNTFRFRITAGGADVNVPDTSTHLLNTWYNVVGTYDGSNMRIYVNGILKNTLAQTGTLATNTETAKIGTFQGTNYNLTGRISNISVYNRTLIASEIQQNFNALRGRFIFLYEQLTYIVSGNLTITGNGTESVNIFKTSGSSAWDNQAYSTTAFTAPCTIEFSKQAASGDNGVSYAMIGWNEDPTTDASYTSLDYASYPYRTDIYSVYHNGSQVSFSGAWSTANKFYIVYGTDGFIRHYNGSTLLYSVNYGAGKTVYVDSSFYSVNATFGGFSDIRVIRSAWNGVSYT